MRLQGLLTKATLLVTIPLLSLGAAVYKWPCTGPSLPNAETIREKCPRGTVCVVQSECAYHFGVDDFRCEEEDAADGHKRGLCVLPIDQFKQGAMNFFQCENRPSTLSMDLWRNFAPGHEGIAIAGTLAGGAEHIYFVKGTKYSKGTALFTYLADLDQESGIIVKVRCSW